MRRVAKAVGWTEDKTPIDGLAFPNLAMGLIHALWHGGVLKGDASLLNLGAPVNVFAARSYAEQVRQVFHGFVQANQWDERGPQAGYFETARLIQARQALVIALTASAGPGRQLLRRGRSGSRPVRANRRAFLLFLPRRPAAQLWEDRRAGPPGVVGLADEAASELARP